MTPPGRLSWFSVMRQTTIRLFRGEENRFYIPCKDVRKLGDSLVQWLIDEPLNYHMLFELQATRAGIETRYELYGYWGVQPSSGYWGKNSIWTPAALGLNCGHLRWKLRFGHLLPDYHWWSGVLYCSPDEKNPESVYLTATPTGAVSVR